MSTKTRKRSRQNVQTIQKYFKPNETHKRNLEIAQNSMFTAEQLKLLRQKYDIPISDIQNYIQRFQVESRLPLSAKYAPSKLKNCFDDSLEMKITSFFINFDPRYYDVFQKALLLKGPPGCGKTSIIKAIESEFDLKVLKISSSTPRSGKAIAKRFKNLTCTQTVHCGNGTHFSFGALLIVEDIDVVLEIDTGFMKQLNSYIPISKIPVILTCRDIPNDLQVRDYIQIIEITNDIQRVCFHLDIINMLEKKQFQTERIRQLLAYFNGNISSTINAMELSKFHYIIGLENPVISYWSKPNHGRMKVINQELNNQINQGVDYLDEIHEFW